MNKIVSVALVLLLLLLLGVALPVGATETIDPTETTANGREYNTVPDPLTWEELNALPIASPDMTEDELRQICVDFMRLQLSVQWTPDKVVKSYVNDGKDIMLRPENVYCGLPYVANSFGNLYNLMTYYDEQTGRVDFNAMGDEIEALIGNQCSCSVYWAWMRVANSIQYEGSSSILFADGYEKIGEYTYDESIENFHKAGVHTTKICRENGNQVMYEAYAQVKPADGFTKYSGNAGHVIMAAAYPVVVYNEDGTIDGDRSYMTYMDQTSSWKNITLEDGTQAQIQSGTDKVTSFGSLYSGGYLPVRIPEFCGTDPVEKGKAYITYEGDVADMASLREADLHTNYDLVNVHIVVTDKNGEDLYNEIIPMGTVSMKGYMLKSLLRGKKFDGFAESGENTISISCLMGNGEHLTAYSGKLVAQLPEKEMPVEPTLPGWVIPACIAGAVVIVTGAAAIILVRCRKKKSTDQ